MIERRMLTMSLKWVIPLMVAVAFSLQLPAQQSGLYVPSAKPVRNMQKALTNPEVFHLLLKCGDGEESYSERDLDLLDSAYGIAFAIDNPMYYTMTIEGYGGADEDLVRKRVASVYRYFAMRSHAAFPIRLARNKIHCSCQGDTSEVLRFEVPVTMSVYNVAELPEARRLLNKSIDLEGTVLVTFRNNPDECVGSARGCYVPQHDTVVRGYYSSLLLGKGSVYAVDNTKDTCPGGMSIKMEDHLNYRNVVESYHLIPHRKQLLVMAGYIVVTAQLPVKADSCTEAQKDSIFVRIPVTQEQIDAKLKFFAKVRTAKGVEYKQLPTRKMPGKGQLGLQAPVNITQLDTIYLGKRIQDKEVSKYFYEVNSPTEASAFSVGSRFYVASRPDKNGEPELKKPLRQLFRIVPEQEEEAPFAGKSGKGKDKRKVMNPEEIID